MEDVKSLSLPTEASLPHKRKQSPEVVVPVLRPKKLRSLKTLFKPSEAETYDPKGEGVLKRQKWRSNDDDVINEKKGRFTAEEEKLLRQAVNTYIQEKNLTYEEGIESIFTGRRNEPGVGIMKIAECLPRRSINSIYQFIRRRMRVLKTGKWSRSEEEELVRLSELYGPKWTLIGNRLKRLPESVCEKYNTMCSRGYQLQNKHIYDQLKETVSSQTESEKLNRKFSKTTAHKILTEENMPDRTVKGRLRPFRFSEHFDAQLLSVIKDVMGEALPYKDIKWRKVAAKVPGYHVAQLRQHYYHYLLPKMVFQHGGNNKCSGAMVIARQVIRYFYHNRKRIADINEVDWDKVVLFAPRGLATSLLRRLLQRCTKVEGVKEEPGADDSPCSRSPTRGSRLPTGSLLKKAIKCLYRELQCEQEYESDCLQLLKLSQPDAKRLSVSRAKLRIAQDS